MKETDQKPDGDEGEGENEDEDEDGDGDEAARALRLKGPSTEAISKFEDEGEQLVALYHR